MAGVLGLGSGQASALNQDLLDKLKEADRTALVVPYETKIENITKEGGESAKLAEITAKANELLAAVDPFYQFTTGGVTVFDLKTANTTGSSAVFDTSNEAKLNTGTTKVHISQLATKDVYQSASFDATTKDATINSGKLTIAVAGTDGLYSSSFEFDTTNKTYTDLATEINTNSNFTASVEQVGDSSYRLVIKSQNSGSANALKITQDDTTVDFNFDNKSTATNSFVSTDVAPAGTITINGTSFTTDGTTQTYGDLANLINADSNFNASFDSNGFLNINRTDGAAITVTQDDFGFGLQQNSNGGGKTVSAQNMEAEVDGINYSSSSNVITVDGGLKITAVEVNNANEYSTISVENDSTYVATYMQNLVDVYNQFTELVDTELYSDTSVIEDKSTLRTMMSTIKSKLFGSYGVSDNQRGNLNLFNYGLELDKSGVLSLDTEKLNDAVANNLSDLKSLFFDGYIRDDAGEVSTVKGLGTELKEFLDSLDGYDGLLYSYQENMTARQTSLEAEKTKAEERLNSKYDLLAQQFAAYTSIITQMDSAFSGLKMLIEQASSSSN